MSVYRLSCVIFAFVFVAMLPSQAEAMYDPGTGRFMQRDPAGYVDGMNRYAGYHVMHGGVDPMGMKSLRIVITGRGADPQTVGKNAILGNYDLKDKIYDKLTVPNDDKILIDWDERIKLHEFLEDRLDINPKDGCIDTRETQDLDLRVVGYSQGGISAIHFVNEIAKGKSQGIGDYVTERKRQGKNWIAIGVREDSIHYKDGVPTKVLVTIDPASERTMLKLGKPKVSSNVVDAVNYLQTKGGSTTLYNIELDNNGNQMHSPVTVQSFLGDKIKGNRIDGSTNHVIGSSMTKYKDFSADTSIRFKNRLYEKDVNHLTIVRWVADDVLKLIN